MQELTHICHIAHESCCTYYGELRKQGLQTTRPTHTWMETGRWLHRPYISIWYAGIALPGKDEVSQTYG